MSLPLRSTSWSPMDCLPVAQLTPSGLLELQGQEVLLWTRDGDLELRSINNGEPMVALTPGGNVANTTGKEWIDRTTDVALTITTHRIVFSKDKKASFLHFSNLRTDAPPPQLETSFFKSPRIPLMAVLGDLLLIFRGDKANQNAKDALQFIHTAMRRKEWETEIRVQRLQQEQEARGKNKVGVDKIIARSTARHQQAKSVTTQAFTGDAETLLQEAAVLVNIIQKYVATLDKHDPTGSGNAEEDGGDVDKERLAGMLKDMGMTSALSKADYKGRENAYYEQLARQLADFLRPKLQNTMMTLTDVYCLYNRARGSNLLSPEDLLQAVDRMEDTKLSLGLSHRVFPSGLRVLQDAALDEDRQAERLRAMAADGLNEIEASRKLHVSVLLAQEQLLAAERQGSLVRDETTEGLRFFPNRFSEWAS